MRSLTARRQICWRGCETRGQVAPSGCFGDVRVVCWVWCLEAGGLEKAVGVHIKDYGDVFREGCFCEDALDVIGEGACPVGAEDDLEAELIVRTGERAWEDFAE